MDTREQKKGFSLIELSVVMAIMALLCVLAISALLSIRKTSIVDQATEQLLSEIREAQNEAISVTNAPAPDIGILPVAWGVEIISAAKTMNVVYLKDNKEVVVASARTIKFSQIDSLTTGSPDLFVMFSTPFGKYYAGGASCSFTCWTKNPVVPYDFSYTGGTIITTQINIVITYSGYSRTVVVEPNGDSYVK